MAGFFKFRKRGNDLRVSGSSQMKLIESRCPKCEAPLTFNGNLSTVTCNYCGTTFIVDDIASTTDRVLRAQSEAMARDMQTQLEYEKEHIKYDPAERDKERMWKNSKMALKALIAMMLICGIGIYGMVSWLDGKMTEIDDRNNAYVEQVHEYIKQGDYNSALLVANRIDGDRDLSPDQDARWDAQRRELIRIIKEKQEAEQ